MSPASSDASMLAVADPAALRPTLLAVHSCTCQHANLLVRGQIASDLVEHKSYRNGFLIEKSYPLLTHCTRNTFAIGRKPNLSTATLLSSSPICSQRLALLNE
jgi:hypothetical protein